MKSGFAFFRSSRCSCHSLKPCLNSSARASTAGQLSHLARGEGRAVEGEEEPLAVVLDRREPRQRIVEARDLGADVQLAVDVGGEGLEAGEAGQRAHLGEPVDEHHAVDEGHRLRSLGGEGERAPEEAASGAVGVELDREAKEQIDLRLLHLLVRHRTPLAKAQHLGERRVAGDAFEGRLHRLLELPEHLDLRRGLHVLDQLDDPGDLLAQLGAGIGDVDHACRDREVGVGRGAKEKPHGLAATLVAIVSEPRTSPGAQAQRRLPVGEALGGGAHAEVVAAAAAGDADILKVAGGAGLVEPEDGALAVRVLAVDEVEPRDVVDVALATGPDEADRLDLGGLALAALALVPFTVELVDAQEPARAGPVAPHGLIRVVPAALVLADEPLREAERLDPLALGVVEVPRVSLRRGEQLHALVALLAGEHREQAVFDDLLAAGPPGEAGDHRGVVHEVDRRAGAVAGDDLAVMDLALGPAVLPLHAHLPQLAAHQRSSACASAKATALSFSFIT